MYVLSLCNTCPGCNPGTRGLAISAHNTFEEAAKALLDEIEKIKKDWMDQGACEEEDEITVFECDDDDCVMMYIGNEWDGCIELHINRVYGKIVKE